jgi:hypothetical protein
LGGSWRGNAECFEWKSKPKKTPFENGEELSAHLSLGLQDFMQNSFDKYCFRIKSHGGLDV